MTDESRFALLEQSVMHIHKLLGEIKSHIDKLDNRICKLDNRIWHLIFWIVGSFAATWGILAHAVHWF